MAWSIAEVARLSHVTSRTLRHYDAVGLLPPASVADNGWRYYENEQLLRLQRILLLRELGLSLPAIAEILRRDSGADTAVILTRHRDALREERRRLGRLVRTVEATIHSIEQGDDMPPEKLFHGFAADPHEAQARRRYGDTAIDASYQRMSGWSPVEAERAGTGYATVHAGLAPLLAAGVPVTDEQVQDLIDLHYRTTCLFWTPDAQSYPGLGRTYVEDERFRRNIGGDNDALVDYLCAAMAEYARTRLG